METLMKSLEEMKALVVATGVRWSPSSFCDAAYKAPDGEVGLWKRLSRGDDAFPVADEAELSSAEGWEFHDLQESYPPSGDQPGYCATDWADMPEWLVPYAVNDVLRHINAAVGVYDGDIAVSLLRRMREEGYRFRSVYWDRWGEGMAMWEVEGGEKSHVFVHPKSMQVVFADSPAEAIKAIRIFES